MKHAQLVKRFINDVLNHGDLQTIAEIVHPDYHYTSPTECMEGVDSLKAFVAGFRNAFPDLQVDILHQFECGETVCTRIRFRGTHLGEYLDMPATNQPVDIEGCLISQVRDGRIAKEWEILDQLTMLQQLGATNAENSPVKTR